VLLKGPGSVIARPDGSFSVCPSGSPALAKGGTGDVLAGILGAVLAARREEFWMDPGYFAAVGSSIHAMAGNLAVRKTGEHGLMASDIADAVGSVLG
jgi:NAD(P)H-hydrate epimerase